MNKIYIFVLVLFLTITTSCRYPTEEKDSSVYIQWDNDISATYQYDQHDTYTGLDIITNFIVTKGSGKMVITVRVINDDSNSKFIEYDVEEGDSHKLIIPVSFSGKTDCSIGTVLATIEINDGSTDPLIYPIKCELNDSGYSVFILGALKIL